MLESKNYLKEDEPLKLNSFNIDSRQEYNSSIQTNFNLINNESLFSQNNKKVNETNKEIKDNSGKSKKNIKRLKCYFFCGNFPLITFGPNSMLLFIKLYFFYSQDSSLFILFIYYHCNNS